MGVFLVWAAVANIFPTYDLRVVNKMLHPPRLVRAQEDWVSPFISPPATVRVRFDDEGEVGDS